VLAIVSCSPAETADAAPQPFAPQQSRTLSSFGAIGDGRSDDTPALMRALAESKAFCIDGGGRTYSLSGTLKVTSDLCLRNVRLVQVLKPANVLPYLSHSCARPVSSAALLDCGSPSISPSALRSLWPALSVRTLLIRPAEGAPRIRVTLENVSVDRGPYPQSGSRSDSAGIWLEGASHADFRNVEITGNGKGYGLMLVNSENIHLANLRIHDMAWSPYSGPLDREAAQQRGWNSFTIQEFRRAGEGGAKQTKFYGTRAQEQLTCAYLEGVRHVFIEKLQIARCTARSTQGNIPLQADGLAIGPRSSDVVIREARIDDVWEGVDVIAGEGVAGLLLEDVHISRAFAFGLKLGYRLQNAVVSGLRVSGAGIAGIAIHGPVNNVRISKAAIRDVGFVEGPAGPTVAWPDVSRAGIRIDRGGPGTKAAGKLPSNILIEDTDVRNEGQPGALEFGLRNEGSRSVRTLRFTAAGLSKAASITQDTAK